MVSLCSRYSVRAFRRRGRVRGKCVQGKSGV